MVATDHDRSIPEARRMKVEGGEVRQIHLCHSMVRWLRAADWFST